MTALVLARDEAPNIGRCVRSLAWCAQVLVFDSGSLDGTPQLAELAGAEVVHEAWLGFGRQRELALGHGLVRCDWVYFVDADEWVSSALAWEVAGVINGPHDAYRQRLRLIFQGRWIRYSGWYGGAWIVRLGRRTAMSYSGAAQYGERAAVEGSVGTLRRDIVDEDLKGLVAWLRKHLIYAGLEAERRRVVAAPFRQRVSRWAARDRGGRSATRSLAKDVVFPAVPARPVLLFLYMYVVRAGFRDGRQGLIFCVMHAWYELLVGQLVEGEAVAPTGKKMSWRSRSSLPAEN